MTSIAALPRELFDIQSISFLRSPSLSIEKGRIEEREAGTDADKILAIVGELDFVRRKISKLLIINNCRSCIESYRFSHQKQDLIQAKLLLIPLLSNLFAAFAVRI
jgi:hypothetical protein